MIILHACISECVELISETAKSEQNSSLLFMTLPNMVKPDHFILGPICRVENGPVKPF